MLCVEWGEGEGGGVLTSEQRKYFLYSYSVSDQQKYANIWFFDVQYKILLSTCPLISHDICTKAIFGPCLDYLLSKRCAGQRNRFTPFLESWFPFQVQKDQRWESLEVFNYWMNVFSWGWLRFNYNYTSFDKLWLWGSRGKCWSVVLSNYRSESMNNLDWSNAEDEKDKRIRELEDTLRKQKELMEILQVHVWMT